MSRYLLPALTWFRLRVYARDNELSLSSACTQLLNIALDAAHVSRDPNYLLYDEADGDGKRGAERMFR